MDKVVDMKNMRLMKFPFVPSEYVRRQIAELSSKDGKKGNRIVEWIELRSAMKSVEGLIGR